MIHAVLIFNNSGKPRLSKFYSPSSPKTRAAILQRIYSLVSGRDDSQCNFVELPQGFGFGDHGEKADVDQEDLRVIYRHYATLYFAFVVDQSESELGILDLIQVFVESLDRCFENVCELDLIFHFDEVHTLLSCLITGGLVLDTSLDSIQATFRAQQQAKKHSQAGGGGGGGGAGGLGLGALGEAAGGLLGGERGAFGFGGARARRGR
ncbi:Adaptor protein complex sigma subunit [Rhodotorula diobovata]|uniref:Adaptor protein complex sigma subunit n=1 Tax=Rhodotorula diobovata TaxID=5288 RepID=A0A5C5G279_9BASI|nr:Adaptor protein complex sigma subunit [Rhodotorula diobovata]